MCRHACPVANASGREFLTPQAKMDRLHQLHHRQRPWSSNDAEPLWGCTGCGQCTTYCKHKNEPGVILLAARSETVAAGAIHPALENYPERFQKRDRRLVATARQEIPQESRAQEGNIGFWPGCDAIDKGMADVQATIALLRHSTQPVPIVDTNLCCFGYPLIASGHREAFANHADKAARIVNRFHTLVTNCSGCSYALRNLYPQRGIKIEASILSLAEYLGQIEPLCPEPEQGQKPVVYYHDPCYLARYENVIDEPRKVLAQVAEVREFSWSKTETECCGGGGLLPKTMPTIADDMARARLSEIAARGGGTVVTSCATCTFMLKRNAPASITVCDLPEILTVHTRELNT